MRRVSLMLIVLAVPVLAPAATLRVPSQYATIQAAIDVASGGDTVLVAPGRYLESIDFKGKAIAVRSSGGSCVTVIDAYLSGGSVVTFASGEGPGSWLEGFTLTNGNGTYMGLGLSLGGGIYCRLSSPTISRNTIIGNHASFGGGVDCSGGSPLIINNTIADNQAFQGAGGGLYCGGGSPQIVNTAITRNTAPSGGAGLYCRDSTCSMTNTIVWENATPTVFEIALQYSSGPCVLTVSHSDVDGGLGAVLVGPGSVLNWGAGMLDADPQFVDSASDDYHLTFGSPCRDTGDNLAIGLPTEDYEGDPRISGGTVDMGSDEFHRHLYQTGNATPGGTIQLKFVGNRGTTQVALVLGLALLDPPVSTSYGNFQIASPFIYIPGLGPIPATGIYALPAQLSASAPAPFSVYLQALIDSELSNLCEIDVM